MTTTLRRNGEGKIVACLESTAGFPAEGLVTRKKGKDPFRFIPAELAHSTGGQDDMLVAFRLGSDAAKAAARGLGLRISGLKPNGYRIESVVHGGRRALVAPSAERGRLRMIE